jgi:hypothetical protein
MLRRSFVVIPILVLAFSACGTTAKTPDAGAPAVGIAPERPSAEATCPATATRKFAKTRFVVNAGLAAGAFKRYIYTPFRNGAFKSGAHGQKRAIVKAGVAGVFALDQLRRAKNNVQADPKLCRTLSAPISKLSSSIKGLTDNMKSGKADPSQLNSTSGALEGFRSQAGNAGAGFKDKNVPPSMVGG